MHSLFQEILHVWLSCLSHVFSVVLIIATSLVIWVARGIEEWCTPLQCMDASLIKYHSNGDSHWKILLVFLLCHYEMATVCHVCICKCRWQVKPWRLYAFMLCIFVLPNSIKVVPTFACINYILCYQAWFDIQTKVKLQLFIHFASVTQGHWEDWAQKWWTGQYHKLKSECRPETNNDFRWLRLIQPCSQLR